MEKKMDNILAEVSDLKTMIESSKEYKEYLKWTRILDKNEKINKLILEIKKMQQKIVNLEHNKNDTKKEEEKLNILFFQLNQEKEYKNYLDASKKLNILITKVQNKFSDAFNNILN